MIRASSCCSRVTVPSGPEPTLTASGGITAGPSDEARDHALTSGYITGASLTVDGGTNA
jgi:hypothetical protein